MPALKAGPGAAFAWPAGSGVCCCELGGSGGAACAPEPFLLLEERLGRREMVSSAEFELQSDSSESPAESEPPAEGEFAEELESAGKRVSSDPYEESGAYGESDESAGEEAEGRRVASTSTSSTQKFQPAGAGPQAGSGLQPAGGAHPSGAGGQFGGGLNLLDMSNTPVVRETTMPLSHALPHSPPLVSTVRNVSSDGRYKFIEISS